MALLPPPNGANVPLPVNPANPPTFGDIYEAVSYVDGLKWTRAHPAHPNLATAAEIGLAESYQSAIIFANQPGGAVAPPWLVQLTNTVNQIQQTTNQLQADVAAIRADMAEQPVLRANSQAGSSGPLYNPTVPGWVLLYHPNPRTCDELMSFTRAQCNASAVALGLPVFPNHMVLLSRKRLIANRIGLVIH